MSARNFRGNGVAGRTLVNPGGWVRNPTWLPMPTVTAADEKVAMLVAVYPESNFIAFTFNTSSGSSTVDWGDGTSENVGSGTTAQHQYTFTDTDLANTNGPVTFTDSTDTVNRTAHGYFNGQTISFATVVTTTGISAGQQYYVVNATANTFQLAASAGGSAIALTTDGSGTILPYKQAIVTVTPNTGGATFSTVNLQVKNTTTGLQTYVQPILDLAISATCSTLTVSGTIVPMRMLEKCAILRHNTGNLSSLVVYCNSLQEFSISDTGSITAMNGMFSDCILLRSIPYMNTVSCTDMAAMFSGCVAVHTVPLFNTANVTNMSSMFSGCNSLEQVPLFNTANVTNMSSMFYNCNSLEQVPLFNTVSVTDMSSMFWDCDAIKTIPLFNTANVTNMSRMFTACTSLVTIPPINTSNVTNVGNSTTSGIFANCTALQSIPLLDTSKVTSMASMFYFCVSLTTVPDLSTAGITATTTAFTNMFQFCRSLQQIGNIAFNRASITTSASYTNMFATCPSLSSIGSTSGPKFTHSLTGCKFSPAALDAWYTALPTVTGQTITVTNNWGNASDTPSIATSKGWTVTG